MRLASGAIGFVPLVLAAALAGCTGTDTPKEATPSSSAPSAPSVTGTFGPFKEGATAVTYDPAAVPAGATATVSVKPGGGGIQVSLTVTGMQPNRTYGSHLHSKPCGAKADAAGPHFQHQPDPAASASPPSVDPAYANPQNEIWLDFTTDAAGKASSTSTVKWVPPAGSPRSVVIHAAATKTGPKEAGTAGARVACLTVAA